MTKSKILGLILTATLLLPVAIAQGGGQARPHPGKNPQQQQRPAGKPGDWIRNHQGMTPEQQQKALENDPGFKNLPPARQEALRQSSQELKTLPEGRQLMVHKALRSLRQMTPEGREEVFKSDRFRNTFSGQEQGILKRLSAFSPPPEEPGSEPGR